MQHSRFVVPTLVYTHSGVLYLSGFKTVFCRVVGRRLQGLQAATLVCLALLLLLVVVQVAHIHPLDSGTDADHCPLCILLQSAAPVAVTAVIVVLVQLGTQLAAPEPARVIVRRPSKLFTRPPPFSC
jgi:hypothetical protein